MNDFVDIWRVFNLVVFEFYEFFTNFFAKHWNSNLQKQLNITFVEIYVKISIKLGKKFPIWQSFIFVERPFFGKIRPCFHHPSITMVIGKFMIWTTIVIMESHSIWSILSIVFDIIKKNGVSKLKTFIIFFIIISRNVF